MGADASAATAGAELLDSGMFGRAGAVVVAVALVGRHCCSLSVKIWGCVGCLMLRCRRGGEADLEVGRSCSNQSV